MSLDPDRVESVTFDSFTTLVDVAGSTTRRLSDYVSDPEPIARLWRSRAVEYRMVSNFIEEYQPYDRITRDALEYALSRFDVTLSDLAVDEIAEVFSELDIYDDVRSTFRTLVDAGYDCYIVSNGNPALLESIVDRADLDSILTGVVSADGVQIYKPALKFYQYAAAEIGTPRENIVHVATPWYDIYGANHAGMQTAWVNRQDRPWETFDGGPDLVVENLDGFRAELLRS